ncbi:hypothetical protein SRA_06766 [Streptococcus ratti FA-1 = DSM 20564]|uniref:Uncharacterized protein n=1 Tax=Streptococcus ratti FA-1 = DSM 20564 TaxID=699248 RepID=A0ABN0GUW5_STRRT|nr:hypothetical protein SRA_06766 [Streptococcus ratti FA-1 = DSM 20564]
MKESRDSGEAVFLHSVVAVFNYQDTKGVMKARRK